MSGDRPGTGPAIVAAFLDAENGRDWDAWAAALDPDIRYRVVGDDAEVRGANAYVAHMRDAYAAIPDWRFRITAIHGDDRTVLVEFDGTGHFTGLVDGRVVREVPLRLAAVCVFELRDGQITAVREYLDVTGRDRQLGRVPGRAGGDRPGTAGAPV